MGRRDGRRELPFFAYAREGHVDLRRRARAADAVQRVALLRPSVLAFVSCALAVARADVLAGGRDAGTPHLAAPRWRARTDGHADAFRAARLKRTRAESTGSTKNST